LGWTHLETTSKLRLFLTQPFKVIDSISLNIHGFQINLLRDDAKLRAALFEIFLVVPLIAWLLMGADSTADQIAYFLVNLPQFILGRMSFTQLIDSSIIRWYGLGTHWSAAVIYSALFIGLSKHLCDRLDVRNSLNLALTTGFVGLSIAAFEFTWMGSYYVFQNQHWILSLGWPQARIILQDALFALTGIIVVAGLNYKEYSLNLEWKTWGLLAASLGLWVLWWYYPFPVQHISVEVAGYGTWTSTNRFPQTMYTVPTDASVAMGELFYVPDQAIHFLNNVTKICTTCFFYKLFQLRRK